MQKQIQDNSTDQEIFDITGLVVRSQPEKAQQVAEHLDALKGVEVHAIGDEGNLVVTIEEIDGEKYAVDTLTQISNVPGVISSSLIYHHSEEETQSQEKMQ
ncbi:MAG: chaperone NapD [Motiliproteus sp.]|nr:chaperone NapD [Motiliproteus sp.]MCW9051565.1 chaperone NapD [Motiliproteus sp.]